MQVSLFPSCVVDAVEPGVGVAAVRVLRRMGHAVDVPRGATCCGQPAWNAGQTAAAAAVARTTLDALDASDADAIVVPAGSCATMMKVFWPELLELAGDHGAASRARALAGRVREFSEFVESEGGPPVTNPSDQTIVYHHSCHMLRELKIHDQPEALAEKAGCTLARSESEARCCGFGGLFSMKLPETSTAMADDILDAAERTEASVVVGCDASCLMHLRGRAERRGSSLRFKHLAQVIEDASS